MRAPALQFPLIWANYLLVWICGTLAAIWPVPGMAAAALLLFLDRRMWRLSRLLACILIFSTAIFYASWRINAMDRAIAALPAWAQDQSAKKAHRLRAKIISTQALPENRLRITLAEVIPAVPLENPSGVDGVPQPLPGMAVWTWSNPPPDTFPLPGQTVEISRPLRPVHYMANDTSNSAEAAMACRGIYWRIWSRADSGRPVISGEANFLAAFRKNLRQKFLLALMPDEYPGDKSASNFSRQLSPAKAILLALIFGDRGAMRQSTMDNFAAATLAHSLALSGQHLCVAGFLGFILILSCASVSPGLYLSRPKTILIALASIPFAVIYLWLGNAPASLVRASCMLFIAAIWLWRGMTFNLLDLLCAALCLILLFQPLAILDAGLQLSALCIAIIGLTLPALARLPVYVPHRLSGWHKKIFFRALQILAISLLIQIAMLPVSLMRFQIAGFWFPLNVFWLPVLGAIVLPLAALGLGLAAFYPHISIAPARFILELAEAPCRFLVEKLASLRDLGFLAEPAFLLPHWANLLAFATLACALGWFFSSTPTIRKKALCARMLCAALFLLAIPPAMRLIGTIDPRIKIEALDVGQGQAIYLKIPGGIRILLDGGGFAGSSFDTGKQLVGPYLSTNAPPRLDAVFNSHPDFDHLGGLFHILSNFHVHNIFHNGKSATKEIHKKWSEIQSMPNAMALKSGDRVILGNPGNNIYLEVLHPGDYGPTLSGWNGNDASLILRLCKNGNGLAIFPGDAEKGALKNLLKTGANLKADILFLPHHGSGGSYLPAFYKAVSPAHVAANCGYQNRWHYPATPVISYFAAKKIEVLDTGRRGKIGFTVNRQGEIRVETSR